jgi:hypothetical protein
VNFPAALANARGFALPSFEDLQDISARDGVDAATAFLYRAVVDSPQHGAFIEEIRSLGGRTASYPPPAGVKLVIVPGGFYREHPRSGADGHVVREQAERLGWPLDSIPVASTGSLLENARTICRWLGEHRDSRIVLVSLSKGGSDLKLALTQPEAGRAFAHVASWINLCGILDGTPMAEWMLSWRVGAVLNRMYYRMLGLSLEFLRDLRREPGCPLDFKLQLPAHLQMISIVGFPLRRHLTSGMARRCHRRLAAACGPNDGVIVLSDVCAQPGLIYPVWGADHYLRSGPDMKQLLEGVLGFVGMEIARCPPAHSTTRD